MKTLVAVRSERFPAYPDEGTALNPGAWERRLADQPVERLGSDTHDVHWAET